MNPTVTERLAALLEAERVALISGDLGRLGSLLAEKEALMADLPALADRPAELGALRETLRRNAQLHDAALAGLRRVVTQIGALQRIRKTLETYDSNGRRQSIPHCAEHRLEKHA